MTGPNKSRWECYAQAGAYTLLGTIHHESIGTLAYYFLAVLLIWTMRRRKQL
jgi:hypothetical protein